VAIVSIQSPLP